MTSGTCCSVSRIRETGGWLLPAAILAFLPKCPLCFIALFVAGTGIGISLTAATYLRAVMVTLCAASLLGVAIRILRRAVTSRNQTL